MADEIKELAFMKTKTGNGYKVCVNDRWLYTSRKNVEEVVNDVQTTCTFSTIESDK